MPPNKMLIATATAAGLTGLGVAALLVPGPAPSSSSPPAPEVRTQVVTHVIHRVRHVTEGSRGAPADRPPSAPAEQPAAVAVAAQPATPVRTRASGAGEEREGEHAERDDEVLEHAEEADD